MGKVMKRASLVSLVEAKQAKCVHNETSKSVHLQCFFFGKELKFVFKMGNMLICLFAFLLKLR